MMINTAILPQDKRDLAIASQTYLSELKDKVSELDIHLVNSGQINIGQQIDAIIGISRSLKEIVSNKQIESDYPIFTTIHQHFDAIAHKLRRCIEIDWITKGLLLEVINLMERMINEYCLENQTTNTDWESLQRELFEQLDQHLSKSIKYG